MPPHAEQQIREIVDAIPADIKADYPEHIFEPERIQIASEIILKEYYKLFPFFAPDDFERMGKTILTWLKGWGYEMAPVADFWNLTDGIMISLKFKEIIPQLTSKNMVWRREELDPKSIALVSGVGTLAEYGRPPYDYPFIKSNIIDVPKALQKNLEISDQKASDTVVSRDTYPIIARRELSGHITLHDGNRRVLRAVLYNKPTIVAWVGSVTADPPLKDYWVNTGFLRRLLAQYHRNPESEIAEALRVQLRQLFSASVIARYNYQTRCVPHYAFAAELAKGII